MTLHGPTSLVHWLAGYDLAGRGAIVEVEEYVEAATQDVTPLGPRGAIKHDAPLGRIMYSVSESGFLRGRQLSLRRLFAAGTVAHPWLSILGHQGGAVGASCNVATDLRLRKRSIAPDLDGISKVSIEYFLEVGGDLYEDARILAHGVVVGVVDVSATPSAAYRLDSGASSNGGAVLCLQVDVDGSRWRGYPNLKLQVRHSGSPGNNYANLGTAFDLERDSKGSTLLTIASGTTVRRYVAVRFAFSGARDTFALMRAYNAGDTVLALDGGAGTERIEVGDMLRIGGDDYEVVAVSPGAGAGQWSVTLGAGLTGNEPDNQSVTLTDTNVSLRYAAALKRM